MAHNRKTIDGTINITADTVTIEDRLLLPDGSALDPSLTFDDDQNTGMYRVGADSIGFSTNGVKRMKLDNGGLNIEGSGTQNNLVIKNSSDVTKFKVLPESNRVTIPKGAENAPSLTFYDSTDQVDNITGLYYIGPNNIGISTDSAKRLDISNSAVESTVDIGIIDGNAAGPSVYLTSDPDTGLYGATDVIGFTVGGLASLSVDRDGTISKTTFSQSATGGHCVYGVRRTTGAQYYELAQHDTASVIDGYCYVKVWHHWDYGTAQTIEPLEFQYNYRNGTYKVMWKQDSTPSDPITIEVYTNGTVVTIYLRVRDFFEGNVEMVYRQMTNSDFNAVGSGTPTGTLSYDTTSTNTWVSNTGTVQAKATTTSTSTTTGAIVCSGGLGVGGDMYLGGGLDVAGDVYIHTNENVEIRDNALDLLFLVNGAAKRTTVTGADIVDKFVVEKDDGTNIFEVNTQDSQIHGPSGTALLPGIVFDANGTADANTGLYKIGADNIGVSTGGNKRLDISNSTVESTVDIKTTSTTTSTSTTTGAIVCSGGLGVAENVHIGGYLKLPTAGGTAAQLDHYEEYTATHTVENGLGSDFFTVSQTIDLSITRIGNLVTLTLGQAAGTANGSTLANLPAGTIPLRFRPAVTQVFVTEVFDNLASVYGSHLVTSSGELLIYAGVSGTSFTSGGSTIIGSTSFSYIV